MHVLGGMNAGGGRKSCTSSDMKPFRIIGRICAHRAWFFAPSRFFCDYKHLGTLESLTKGNVREETAHLPHCSTKCIQQMVIHWLMWKARQINKKQNKKKTIRPKKQAMCSSCWFQPDKMMTSRIECLTKWWKTKNRERNHHLPVKVAAFDHCHPWDMFCLYLFHYCY